MRPQQQKYFIKDESHKLRIQATSQSVLGGPLKQISVDSQQQPSSLLQNQYSINHQISSSNLGSIHNSNNKYPIDNQTQSIYDFTNIHNQSKTGVGGHQNSGSYVLATSGSGGGPGGNLSVNQALNNTAQVSNRRDFKIAKSTVRERHNSMPRGGNPLQNNGSGGKNPLPLPHSTAQQQNLYSNSNLTILGPLHSSTPGTQTISYQQHLEDHTGGQQYPPLVQQSSGGQISQTTGQFFRQQAFTSLGTTSTGATTSGYTTAHQSEQPPLGHQMSNIQQMIITNSLLDPSDGRSTISGTSLPHLQTTKNSFQNRHRNTIVSNTATPAPASQSSFLQQVQNDHQLAQGIVGTQISGNLQTPNLGISSINQIGGIQGSIPQLISNNPQQSMKMRQRRQRKVLQTTSSIGKHPPTSSNDDEILRNQKSGSLIKQQNFGDLILFHQNSNNGIQKGSPLDIFKSDSKVPVNPIHTVFGPNSIDKQGHLQLPQQQINNEEIKQSSPNLLPIQLKHRLSNIPPESSPNRTTHMSLRSIHNMGTTVSHDQESINVSHRDIKIRKINPQSLRFQTAKQILDVNQQASGNMVSPSPLTISSFNMNQSHVSQNSAFVTQSRRGIEAFENEQTYKKQNEQDRTSFNWSSIVETKKELITDLQQTEDHHSSIAQQLPVYKVKSSFNSEDRKRKFVSNNKFQNPLFQPYLAQQSQELKNFIGKSGFTSTPIITQLTNQYDHSSSNIPSTDDQIMRLESFEQINMQSPIKQPGITVNQLKQAQKVLQEQTQSVNGPNQNVEISGFDYPVINSPKQKFDDEDAIQSPANLDIIVEENNDETIRSNHSKIKENSFERSNSNLSNAMKTFKSQNKTTSEISPLMNKFHLWKKNSSAFQKIYKQIYENFKQSPSPNVSFNQTQLSEEIEAYIDSLSKLSAVGGNALSKDELRQCILTLKKTYYVKEKFQTNYQKRVRQRSFGGVSRSGDYFNFSYNNGGGSSSSIIEENIQVNQFSNSHRSLNYSLSQVMKNQGTQNQVKQILAIGLNVTQENNNKSSQQKAAKPADTATNGSQITDKQKPQKESPPIGDSGNSGNSGNSEPPKMQSFDSKSLTGANMVLSSVEVKRLQYSQKHQSNKVKILQGSNNNTSSNSLVGGALQLTSLQKVRSYQHNQSQDGSSSQKSDPNQNRLNKLSSGSRTDSYYIPQSGESFHFHPSKLMANRQSKSLARGQVEGGIQSARQNFTDVINGQKAVMSERKQILMEKIQGKLIQWRELKILGSGASGEVYLVQNIVKNATQPQFFVVKKLQIISPNSGVDKEAVAKLKKEIDVYRKLTHENIVKYIGSEIVGNHFCIYLEFLAGGSILSNYQAHPNSRLPEPQIKNYTKQVLSGLVYLHKNKVVHGDLKGANVLVDESRKIVKLTDFGSAKLFDSSRSQSDISNEIRGSLPWMAPEVLLNKGVRRKADVWSLGCLVLEMAIGGNPWGQELFGTDNNFQAMLKIIDPNIMPTIPEQLSDECKDFIRKCLTRDYDQRPSAEDMEKHSWIAQVNSEETEPANSSSN